MIDCTENMRLLKVAQPPLYDRVISFDGDIIEYEDHDIEEVKTECNEVDTVCSELIIIFGLGNGQHLEYMTKEILKYQVIIVIEKDIEPFIHFINNHDYKRHTEKGTAFICGEHDHDKILKFVRQFYWQMVTDKYTVVVNRKNVTDFKWYSELWFKFLTGINEFEIEINTTCNRSDNMLSNIINNTNNVIKYPGVEQFKDKYTGKMAVVCCAGPSLKENLPLIKNNADNLVIISVDTAINPLLNAGIVPDFCVAIDYSDINLLKFKGLDDIETVFCILPSVLPELYDIKPQKKASFFTPSRIYKMISEVVGNKGFMHCGGTVAHGAYSLSKFVGCDRVIFCGLDLAFVDDKTHTDGSMYDSYEYRDIGTKAVPSNDGGTVQTSPAMWSFIPTFAELFKEDEKLVKINTSLRGAKIDHIPVVSLKDALLSLSKTTDCKTHAGGLYCSEVPLLRSKADIYRQTSKDLGIIKNLSKKGLKSCDYILLKLKDAKPDDELIKKEARIIWETVDKIEKLSTTQDFIEGLVMGITYMFHKSIKTPDLFYPSAESMPRLLIEVKRFFYGVSEVCTEYKDKINNATKQ